MNLNRQDMDLKINYHYKTKEIERKINTLKKIVKKHNYQFSKNSNNMGFLIDLINLENRIDEVIHFTQGSV
jgi:hypothetical protein